LEIQENEMKTPEAIQRYLREMLVLSIETKAEKYDQEEWRTGIPGAILEGRITLLEEILDWMESDSVEV
jgi:hypothetical protein